jgi:hypothetical protein
MRRTALLASVLCALSSSAAVADGVPAYLDGSEWRLASEQSQLAVVALAGGVETLLLRVDLDDETTPATALRLVWLTPVPAPAGEVKVGVLRGFPHFSGVEPGPWLRGWAGGALMLAGLTQVWPTFFYLVLTWRGGLGAKSADALDGVEVHARVREAGLEVELVSAASLEGLREHLRGRGVSFPEAGLLALSPYLGPRASLVIARVADLPAYRAASTGERGARLDLGIEIRFPSQQGFFPLVASAALPGESLAVVVTALGLHEAVEPAPVGLRTRHFVGSAWSHGEDDYSARVREALGLGPTAEDDEELTYTRIVLQARPAELTADLRFAPGAPAGVRAAAALALWPWLGALGVALWIALVAGMGALASLAVRRAWPAEARPSRGVASLLGLANLLTWIGYLVAVLLYGRRRGVAQGRRLRVALLANLAFCGMVVGLWAAGLLLG